VPRGRRARGRSANRQAGASRRGISSPALDAANCGTHSVPFRRHLFASGTLSSLPKSWRDGGLKRVPEFPLRIGPVRIQRPTRFVSEGQPASPPLLSLSCLPGESFRPRAWPGESFVLPDRYTPSSAAGQPRAQPTGASLPLRAWPGQPCRHSAGPRGVARTRGPAAALTREARPVVRRLRRPNAALRPASSAAWSGPPSLAQRGPRDAMRALPRGRPPPRAGAASSARRAKRSGGASGVVGEEAGGLLVLARGAIWPGRRQRDRKRGRRPAPRSGCSSRQRGARHGPRGSGAEAAAWPSRSRRRGGGSRPVDLGESVARRAHVAHGVSRSPEGRIPEVSATRCRREEYVCKDGEQVSCSSPIPTRLPGNGRVRSWG
jgi:hypothetical protein